MKVVFSNIKGEKKALRLRFSIWYFLLGPFYLLINKKVIRALILAFIYVFAIWQGLGSLLVDLLLKTGINQNYVNFLLIPGQHYLYTLIALGGLHVLVSFIVPRIIAKRILKKGYLPFSEIDTQKLIKYRLVKIGCKSFLSAFTPVEGVPGKIVVHNEEEYAYYIEQLTELLRSGLITKDEYNVRKAAIFMKTKSKK